MLAPRTSSSGGAAVVMAQRGKRASAARQSEIIEEIVENLRPWKKRQSDATVTASVERALEVLLALTPVQSRLLNKTNNREHAKRLDGVLSDLETVLAGTPELLAWYLFEPPRDLPDRIPELAEVMRAYSARASAFAAEVKRLRRVCSSAIGPGVWQPSEL